MDGQPVWLASVSRVDTLGRTIATSNWTELERHNGLVELRKLLKGVGNPDFETFFRMQITFCMHRALKASEASLIPPPSGRFSHLAGGAVEVFYCRGTSGASLQPCRKPTRHYLEPRTPDLWLPIDCGKCPTCLVRAKYERSTP